MYAIALGSNLGDRKKNLTHAKDLMHKIGLNILRTSYIYETPALLPISAPNSWSLNFLNQAVLCESKLEPLELLNTLKSIESQMGRKHTEAKWAPRIIDLDILAHDKSNYSDERLCIPHKELFNRSFFLNPLADICPDWRVNSSSIRSAKKSKNIPKLVQILNLTPDSFSDGGNNVSFKNWETLLQKAEEQNISVLDIGAESTRPMATPLSAEEEWLRLEPALDFFLTNRSSVKISLDTYHISSAQKAIEMGVDIINDVSGLQQKAFLQLAGQCDQQFIFMHNLGLPSDKNKIISTEVNPVAYLKNWLSKQLEVFSVHNIKTNQLIFDPGIGFGKNAAQSFEILKHIDEFNTFETMVGHSRKSFLTGITQKDFSQRDPETLGLSFALAEKGVDYLRVHNSQLHHQAFLAYNSIQ